MQPDTPHHRTKHDDYINDNSGACNILRVVVGIHRGKDE